MQLGQRHRAETQGRDAGQSSQGPRSWKRQKDPPLGLPEGAQLCSHLDFRPGLQAVGEDIAAVFSCAIGGTQSRHSFPAAAGPGNPSPTITWQASPTCLHAMPQPCSGPTSRGCPYSPGTEREVGGRRQSDWELGRWKTTDSRGSRCRAWPAWASRRPSPPMGLDHRRALCLCPFPWCEHKYPGDRGTSSLLPHPVGSTELGAGGTETFGPELPPANAQPACRTSAHCAAVPLVFFQVTLSFKSTLKGDSPWQV